MKTDLNLVSSSTPPKRLNQGNASVPDLFEKTLALSSLTIEKLLAIIEFACRSLLELSKTFSKIFLLITGAYALLIWRHFPAEEPRTLILCWCASLVTINLGEKALDGKKAPPMTYHLALLVVAYLFPVKAFSELLQAF
jgi:hypothetical protein